MQVKKIIILFCCFVLLQSGVMAGQMIAKMDFVDAAVLDVIRTLAAKAGLDVVISGDVNMAQNKKTTLHLENIPVEEAIDHILRTNGLMYEKIGRAILVSVLPQEQAEGIYKGEIEAVKLKYLSAEKISSLLEKVLPSLKATPGQRANLVVIRGRSNLISEAKALILAIDKSIPQVLIESQVLEISASDSVRLGLSIGNQSGGLVFITDKESSQTKFSQDLQTTLNALISQGKAKVVATPRIATLDNHEAIINIGSRIPYAVPVSNGSSSTQWAVEYIDAGVKLKITPQLGEEGYVTAFIQPEVSSISEWRTTSAGEFPVITTRNAQATLRVKNGETIVVGGLLSETDRENISKIPILGHLPIAGLLFTNRTVERAKTEIIFLITPYVI